MHRHDHRDALAAVCDDLRPADLNLIELRPPACVQDGEGPLPAGIAGRLAQVSQTLTEIAYFEPKSGCFWPKIDVTH